MGARKPSASTRLPLGICCRPPLHEGPLLVHAGGSRSGWGWGRQPQGPGAKLSPWPSTCSLLAFPKDHPGQSGPTQLDSRHSICRGPVGQKCLAPWCL